MKKNLTIAMAIGLVMATGCATSDEIVPDPGDAHPTETSTIEELLSDPLRAGDAAPNFTLPDGNGNMLSLADELQDNQLVILVFYRAFDCSLCISQLVELESDRALYEEMGAQIIALAVQSQEHAGRTVENTQAQFPILADDEHTVAGAFGVYDLLSDRLAAPSVFIIKRDGQIAWERIVERTIDRISSQTIMENLP